MGNFIDNLSSTLNIRVVKTNKVQLYSLKQTQNLANGFSFYAN